MNTPKFGHLFRTADRFNDPSSTWVVQMY